MKIAPTAIVPEMNRIPCHEEFDDWEREFATSKQRAVAETAVAALQKPAKVIEC
jgi:hypothetical protein